MDAKMCFSRSLYARLEKKESYFEYRTLPFKVFKSFDI